MNEKKEKRMIEIPVHLAKRAEATAVKFGYVSLTEFVRDSIRRRIEELEKEGRN